MKNLKLTVFFIQATLESDIKHFTFITPNPDIIYEKINISQQNYEFILPAVKPRPSGRGCKAVKPSA